MTNSYDKLWEEYRKGPPLASLRASPSKAQGPTPMSEHVAAGEVERLVERGKIVATDISYDRIRPHAAETVLVMAARLSSLAAENERLREALNDLLPGMLCGESWGLPDEEMVSILTTFGKLRRARAALPTPEEKGGGSPAEHTAETMRAADAQMPEIRCHDHD